MKGSRWNIDLADQALARFRRNPLRATVASADPVPEEEAVQGLGHIVQREIERIRRFAETRWPYGVAEEQCDLTALLTSNSPPRPCG